MCVCVCVCVCVCMFACVCVCVRLQFFATCVTSVSVIQLTLDVPGEENYSLTACHLPGESIGQFSFQASDGTNNDILRTFYVRAHPVVLQLRHSGPLAVFPNTIHPVSNASLLATTTSSNFSKPIVFTVVDPKPHKGRDRHTPCVHRSGS